MASKKSHRPCRPGHVIWNMMLLLMVLLLMECATLLASAKGVTAFTPFEIQVVAPLSQEKRQRRRSNFISSRLKSGERCSGVLPFPLATGNPGSKSSSSLSFSHAVVSDESKDSGLLVRIHGKLYNLTAWAAEHPGGIEILHKFHQTNKDATQAFDQVGHSAHALELLSTLPVVVDGYSENCANATIISSSTAAAGVDVVSARRPWRKLLTKEDPYAIHKTLGVYCLLHFVYRYAVSLFFGGSNANAAAGLCWNRKNVLFLLPHALLSLSSFLFVTVPRQRVVGKTIIWQEYRVHNAVFAWRSIITTLLALWGSSSAIHNSVSSSTSGMLSGRRSMAVWGSSIFTLLTMLAADQATARLRVNPNETTTATMPYWQGCTAKRERFHKALYAYSQFMATLACLWTTNPALPFATLMVIQVASFLMTLSRKSIITTYQSHMIYTITLFLPWLVGLRGMVQTGAYVEFSAMAAMGMLLFQLRKQLRMNKYVLWIPVMMARVLWGDRWLDWSSW